MIQVSLVSNLQGQVPSTERLNLLLMIRAMQQAADDNFVFRLAVAIQPLVYTYGSVDDRIPIAQAALSAARAGGDLAAQARALRDLATAERLTDAVPSSLVHSREAHAAYDALGDPSGMADAANAMGLVLLAQRELDQALQVFTDAAHRARVTAQPRWAAILKTNIAYTLELQGAFADSAETAGQAIAELEASGYQGPMVLEAYGMVVRASTQLGRWDQARQSLEATDRYLDAGAEPAVQTVLLADRAELALATGEPARAEDLLWQAQSVGRALGNRALHARILTAAGRAQRMLGRPQRSAEFHRCAVQMRRGLPDKFKIAEALNHLAEVLDVTDATDEAAAARIEVVELLAGYDDPLAKALRTRALGTV